MRPNRVSAEALRRHRRFGAAMGPRPTSAATAAAYLAYGALRCGYSIALNGIDGYLGMVAIASPRFLIAAAFLVLRLIIYPVALLAVMRCEPVADLECVHSPDRQILCVLRTEGDQDAPRAIEGGRQH